MKLIERGLLLTWCIGALFAVGVGCNKSSSDREGSDLRDRDLEDKSGVTTTTGAGIGNMSNDLAAQRIVAARCARETACNNVGPDKHFVDRQVCEHSLGERMSTELKPSECSRGLDANAVDKCMDAIRNESCTNPIDTLQRLAACRTSELCVKEQTR